MNQKRFVIMAKPMGALCNMRCSYCYYLPKAELPGGTGRMSDEVLEAFIRNYIEESPGPVISFTWHGGEPSLAGLDFYRKVLQLQEKYLAEKKQHAAAEPSGPAGTSDETDGAAAPESFVIWNNLQTNGTLLDDAWCAFLAENHFDVGLSIDGTEDIQDRYRPFPDGSKSYQTVAASAKRLMQHGVHPDLLCTVTADTAARGREVYRTLSAFSTGWIQFIPIVRREVIPSSGPASARVGRPANPGNLSHTETPDSVTAEAYGEFLKDVFAEWFFHDLGRLNVQFFAEIAKVLAGGEASLCTMAPVCGNVLVVEHDGGIYSCDHFVDEPHLLGNVLTDRFQDVLAGPFQQSFGSSKQDALTAECRACPHLKICSGGCLKDRFGLSKDGEPGMHVLCRGLKSFFDYAVPKLQFAIRRSQEGASSEQIMQEATNLERRFMKGIGRNEFCPCGSGKKFKNCCMHRVP